MKYTFGKQLKNFALSVDVVDSSICGNVRLLVENYFMRELNMLHYGVMIDGVDLKAQPALQTATVDGKYWTNSETSDTVPVTEKDGEYKAQSTFAYANGITLWVTGKSGEPLNEVEQIQEIWQYVDHWGHIEGIPRFYESSKADVRTSIIFPLKYGKRVFGFLCLESAEVLKINEKAKNELQMVVDALGIILWLNDASKHRITCSKDALKDILDWTQVQRHITPLKNEKVFIACSTKADNEVMGAIRETVHKFEELEVVYWQDINEQGNIVSQISDKIRSCSFGICYFSEPDTHNAGYFIDNPKVLFEAGMLNALESQSDMSATWIPIREKKSPEIPFDFAQERIIEVVRLNHDTFNRESFIEQLTRRLKALCMSN
ncbi:MAG: GAF domain-containing protein [Desulfuromusa sp.]|nr:GAF domain-containing protein [Desulfuromusa sp.]